MKKKVLSLLVAGSLLSICIPNHSEAASKKTAEKSIVATFTGWADGHSFETKYYKKHKKRFMIFRTNNRWYPKHLKEGHKYRYFYKKNKYGQYVITHIWK
ncbi:hypothetical protein MOF23_07135 [Bacillus inaquosorum]|uniref:hypothetical protein n=1 Tax=Bacillus inaquosorum TaxID=483913 RepID=UPI0022832340|nr:hypothetical protein [Bacillus inaquosorum]MCY9308750.1 hypothetical protein [Bacillus inaquosorum]